jgi:mono/diheme cytochrome c family protein
MRVLAALGVIGIAAAIAGLVYFLGGFYNVSAIEPDNKAVTWALTRVRQASISRRAPEKSPINLDDPAIIQAGARAFAARGCVTCHGAPGADWAKFSEGLRPDAADLSEVAKALPAGEIFWAIKNGINMTGMPSFARIGVNDDEIWKIAAFVKKFPDVKPEDYKSWTSAGQ